MRKDTRARDFSKEVKRRIAERDSFDGWPCCVYCGNPAPQYNDGDEFPLTWSNAHYISRAQGGLGIEENGLTLCPRCHHTYDQTTHRDKYREYFREYLMDHYPAWDESKLYYQKGGT